MVRPGGNDRVVTLAGQENGQTSGINTIARPSHTTMVIRPNFQ
jgi:hypothetical protein